MYMKNASVHSVYDYIVCLFSLLAVIMVHKLDSLHCSDLCRTQNSEFHLKSSRSENHTPSFHLFNRSIRPYIL